MTSKAAYSNADREFRAKKGTAGRLRLTGANPFLRLYVHLLRNGLSRSFKSMVAYFYFFASFATLDDEGRHGLIV